ncbi:TIGR03364 family FAD-dependent oxidoreductase [Agromyces protaetiae]|uniref:TIGR03364 family FAD-dependent oxidoreductase n=1 Tax=Agromyces protaetiae TaxID=2509455 RepID=A0A4P6FF43_9MICO|nr:TIGR03364 family FAD-dependent oxidoreductase [Agromyces protaetiae]QAY74555.1 TIGR03364 family FAD-dependent oxidoreductase [Agromyces protaetiae]
MGIRADLAVVGAGVVGLGVALAAHRRGLRVVVIDRDASPQGASVRNFGHLCLTAQSGLARRLAITARPIWLELARDAGIPVAESGTLVAARADDEFAVLEQFAAARADEREHERAGGLASLGDGAEVRLLTADEAAERMPVPASSLVGGAFLPHDLQTDPRIAAPLLRRHLESLGVEFRLRTLVSAVAPGRVETSRGPIEADAVVVATNHDLDQLFPGVAERADVVRCALDMLRIRAELPTPLAAPLFTAWSLVRYAAWADLPATGALRERLHAEHPALAALDPNLMFTPQADGTLLAGDTHMRGASVSPFQAEAAFDAMLDATAELFGAARPTVVERWQGVYASGPDEFLVEETAPGVHLAAVTTGIGMTTGLGLGDHLVAAIADGTTTSGETSVFAPLPSASRPKGEPA